MDWLNVKAVAKVFILPPASLLILGAAGLLLVRRKPLLGYALVAASLASIYLLSTPWFSRQIVEALDDASPFNEKAAGSARAIVILGGGLDRVQGTKSGFDLAPLTLERVRKGARLARLEHLPVLVSGGPLGDRPPEADLMRDALRDEFGIDPTWIDTRSRDTRENAACSAILLKNSGIESVLLVTHPFDTRRPRLEFEAAGIHVVGAPAMVPRAHAGVHLSDFLPSIGSINSSHYAIYEIVGLIYVAMFEGRAGTPTCPA